MSPDKKRNIGCLLFFGGLVGSVMVFAFFFGLGQNDSVATWTLYRLLSGISFASFCGGILLWIVGLIQSRRL